MTRALLVAMLVVLGTSMSSAKDKLEPYRATLCVAVPPEALVNLYREISLRGGVKEEDLDKELEEAGYTITTELIEEALVAEVRASLYREYVKSLAKMHTETLDNLENVLRHSPNLIFSEFGSAKSSWQNLFKIDKQLREMCNGDIHC